MSVSICESVDPFPCPTEDSHPTEKGLKRGVRARRPLWARGSSPESREGPESGVRLIRGRAGPSGRAAQPHALHFLPEVTQAGLGTRLLAIGKHPNVCLGAVTAAWTPRAGPGWSLGPGLLEVTAS